MAELETLPFKYDLKTSPVKNLFSRKLYSVSIRLSARPVTEERIIIMQIENLMKAGVKPIDLIRNSVLIFRNSTARFFVRIESACLFLKSHL